MSIKRKTRTASAAIRKLGVIIAFTLDLSIGAALSNLAVLGITDAQARQLMKEYATQGFEAKNGKISYNYSDKETETKKKIKAKQIFKKYVENIGQPKKRPPYFFGSLAGMSLARLAGKKSRKLLLRRR